MPWRGQSRGTRGPVVDSIDGLIRDLDELDALGLPVYGAGITPNGPYKSGPGEIGFPVALGDLGGETPAWLGGLIAEVPVQDS